MPTFRDNYALGTDVSSYQPYVDWKMIKAGGISWAAARASYGYYGKDACFASHVQGAYDADLPIIAYHALWPSYYAGALQSLEKIREMDHWLPVEKDVQLQLFLKACANKKLYGVMVDFEVALGANNEVLPSSWLCEIAKQFTRRVKEAFPSLPVFFYSGSWFINQYCREIETSAILVDLAKPWVAFYPYGSGTVTTTWEDFKKYYPSETMKVNGRETQNPPYLGWSNWTLWQFSGDKFILPGICDSNKKPRTGDFNLFNGPVDKLYELLKFSSKPVVTPEPEPEPEPTPTDQPDWAVRMEAKIDTIKTAVVK